MLTILLALLTPPDLAAVQAPSLYEEVCRNLRWQLAKEGPKGVRPAFWTQAKIAGCKFPTPPSDTHASDAPHYQRVLKRKATYSPPGSGSLPRPERNKQVAIWVTAASLPEPAPKQVEVEADDEEGRIIVEARPLFDCPSPALGWLGVTDNRADEPDDRRVNFDGNAPEARTGASNAVPLLNEVIRFTDKQPAAIFASLLPCFLRDEDRCATTRTSGVFQVVGRIREAAGPRGQRRWQLCVIKIGEAK